MQRKSFIVGSRPWVSLAMGLLLTPMGVMAAEKGEVGGPAERALSAEEWRTALVSTRTPAGRQVQVGPRDTLWSLARVHRPANDITIKQAMLAIRDANPHAFPSRNINEMEAGSRLVIPSAAAMRSRTAAQAEEEVRRQNQLWVASRVPEPVVPARPAASRPAVPAQQAATPQTPAQAPSSQPAPQPALQLSAAPTPSQTETNALRTAQQRLNTIEEELQGVERERDELAERLGDMQQQVNTLQSLIRLKDDQLSDLEQQLIDRPQVIVEVPALQSAQPSSQPPVPVAPQGLDAVKAQPLPYALAGGLGLMALLLLWGLLAARRQLSRAQQAAQAAQEKHKTLEEDLLAAHNATSSDFDLDVHAHPITELDELDASVDLQDLSDDLDQDPLSDAALDSLAASDAQSSTAGPAMATEQPMDPLVEAQSLVAYGRLEQAAQILEAAITAQPEREDLRLKLLEVLVELDDQPQFAQQHQALLQAGASSLAFNKAEDLARLMTASGPQSTAPTFEPDSGTQDVDLGDITLDDGDLKELDLGQDLDLGELDFEATDLEDLDLGEVDLGEVDLAEFDRDLAAEPVAPVAEPSADDELELLLAATQDEIKPQTAPAATELSDLEDTDFDFELNLDQPLEEQELEGDLVDIADFDPVQPNQDADDFLSALDGLEDTSETSPAPTEQAAVDPLIDTELSALGEDLSELESLMIHEDLQAEQDVSDLEIPSSPSETPATSVAPDQQEQDWAEELTTDQLDGLDALGDLEDLDFAAEESEWTTQLDLATAYIEMGDKQGARDILEKIVELADPDHAATAQQMLEQLG